MGAPKKKLELEPEKKSEPVAYLMPAGNTIEINSSDLAFMKDIALISEDEMRELLLGNEYAANLNISTKDVLQFLKDKLITEDEARQIMGFCPKA